MLTASQLTRALQFSQSVGRGPGDSLCDRNWSATEWNNRQHRQRLGRAERTSQVSTPEPEFTIVPSEPSFRFYNPSRRVGPRYKHVQAVRMRDGQIIPSYWPIDSKTGIAYQDCPF